MLRIEGGCNNNSSNNNFNTMNEQRSAAKVFALFESFVPQVLPTQTTSNGFCGLLAKNFYIDCCCTSLCSSSFSSSLPPSLTCHPLAARAYDIPHDIQSVLEIDFIDQSRRTAAHSHCSPFPLLLAHLQHQLLCDTRTCRNLLKYIQLCCMLPCLCSLFVQPGGKRSELNTR